MSAPATVNPIVLAFKVQLANTIAPNGPDGAAMNVSEARQIRDLAAAAAKEGKDVFECVREAWTSSRINPTGTTSEYLSQLSRILGSHEPQIGEEPTVTEFRNALIDVMHPNSRKALDGSEYGSDTETKLVRGLVTQAFIEQARNPGSDVFSTVRDIWTSSGINPTGKTSDYIASLNPISVSCEDGCQK